MTTTDLQTIINDQRVQLLNQNVMIAQMNRMIVSLSKENQQLHNRCNSLSENMMRFSSVITQKAVQEQDLVLKLEHLRSLYESLHSKYRNQLEYAGKLRLNQIAQSPLSRQCCEYNLEYKPDCSLDYSTDYDPHDPQDVANLTLT